MRGGGTVFGPVPRDYRQYITPRAKRQALCCLLSDRARGERLSVVRGLAVEAPKTKVVARMLEKAAPEARKTLIVTADHAPNVVLSSRNLPLVTVRTAADVNALDVLHASRVLVQEEALAKLEERLS